MGARIMNYYFYIFLAFCLQITIECIIIEIVINLFIQRRIIMENATKALLIAASVLVVIILIAISIRILSSTSGVTNQVDTVSSNLETSMFNSQFSSIAGSNVSGTQVKSLISKVIVNNAQNSQHPTNQIYHYQLLGLKVSKRPKNKTSHFCSLQNMRPTCK